MNPKSISPDDPRLTAYALNEMEPAERAEFEQSLAQDAAARQAVAEISATVSTLAAALEDEPVEPAEIPAAKCDPYAKVIQFPYWKVSGLAAACFAFFFIYWQRSEVLHPQKQYIEVPLAAPTEKTVGETSAVSVDMPVAAAALAEPSAVGVEEAVRDEMEAKATVSVAERAQEVAVSEQAMTDQFEVFKKEARAAAPIPMTLKAQSAPPVLAARQPPQDVVAGGVARLDAADEKLVLNPFTVTPSTGHGYSAESTLAGTRVRPGVSDAAGYISAGREKRSNMRFAAALAERESNTEAYGFRKDNDYLRVSDNPLSTFSVDVDTASYANVRRFLTQGQRPPADAVRIEELVNYFPYHYAAPEAEVGRVPSPANGSNSRGGGTPPTLAPFVAHLEVAGAPWAPAHRLVRIGLKGRELSEESRPAANLVFLLDVSGSMNQPNKLPLVKQSLRLLVEKLRPEDRVAIAVYAGASGLALPSTGAAHKAEIMEAIDRLQAEGSTNGAMGIQLAYDIAKANFITGGVNRVILATDGDFNVGVTSEGGLVRLVEEKAKSGVFLTVLGYGMGNLKDGTLEQLADKGNGNYAYIDTLAEAKKTLVEQAGGTLVTIAKDVKIQVEFNPAVVQAYRLIGYENRLLAREDFNNDKIDAGEVGAGHTVTALYEVVPVGAEMPGAGTVDPLKYQKLQAPSSRLQASSELLTVKIRYKEPAGDTSSKLEFPLRDAGMAFAGASQDFKFAAAVAAFGMVLRDSPHKGAATLADVIAWGRAGLGSDAGGYRNEFIGLVERAQGLLQ